MSISCESSGWFEPRDGDLSDCDREGEADVGREDGILSISGLFVRFGGEPVKGLVLPGGTEFTVGGGGATYELLECGGTEYDLGGECTPSGTGVVMFAGLC